MPTEPVPAGKQKVLDAKADLREEMKRLLGLMDESLKTIVNCATAMKKEAYFNSRAEIVRPNFALLTEKHGEMVGAVTMVGAQLGAIGGYSESISRINEAIQEGETASDQDEGQEEGEGVEAQQAQQPKRTGTSLDAPEDEEAQGEPEEEPVRVRGSSVKRSRGQQSGDRKPAKRAASNRGGDKRKPVEGSKARTRDRADGARKRGR